MPLWTAGERYDLSGGFCTPPGRGAVESRRGRLLALREVVQAHGIAHGLILSGLGSLDRYHVHVVKTTNMPPGDTFFQGEGPFDILTLTGAILAGRVHAHITFSNTEKALGGHLEEDCRILTFGVVTLAETDSLDLTGWDRVGPL